jgi:hypothetical protein
MVGAERRYFLAIGAMASLILAALVFLWMRAASGGGALPDASTPRGPLSGGTGSIETQIVTGPTTPEATGSGGANQSPLATAEVTVSSTPAPPPPLASPLAAPTVPATPAPLPAAETPAASEHSNLSDRWRIVDTVSEGAGSGQTFVFDVVLLQSGSSVSGGNFELSLAGTLDASGLTAQFTQPSGITGNFSWSLGSGGNGSGTFQSSVPNGGTSQLIRLP